MQQITSQIKDNTAQLVTIGVDKKASGFCIIEIKKPIIKVIFKALNPAAPDSHKINNPSMISHYRQVAVCLRIEEGVRVAISTI